MRSSQHRYAVIAIALAGASALVSTWWLLGGTTGLDSLGGGLERMARERSAGALVALTAVIVAKLVAAALAWSLTRPRPPRSLVLLATWGGVALAAYGLLLTAGGAVGLIIDGAVTEGGADRHALVWHTVLWDPWFALWGVALALAGRSRLGLRPGAATG